MGGDCQAETPLRVRTVIVAAIVISVVVRFADSQLLEGMDLLRLVAIAGSAILLAVLFPCSLLLWLWYRKTPEVPGYRSAARGFKGCVFFITCILMPSILDVPDHMRVFYHIGWCEAYVNKLEEFRAREGRYPISKQEAREKISIVPTLRVKLASTSYSILIPLRQKTQRLSLDGPPAHWEYADSMNSDRPAMSIPVGMMKGFPEHLATYGPSMRPFSSRNDQEDYE